MRTTLNLPDALVEAAKAAGDRGLRGNLVPDAWLAALARTHGARLATADRGFARYPSVDWFVPVT